MQSDVIDKAYSLANSIKELDLYKDIKRLDREIEEKLADKLKRFNKAKENYSEAMKYGKYHPSLNDYESELSEAKASLYSEELVKEYNKKYREFSKLLDDVFDEIKISISNKYELSNNKKGCECKK